MTPDGEHERRGFGHNYLHGLQHSARENASAYGYSVTITASFGLLNVIVGSPSVLEIFVFAGGAVLAVALVEAVAPRGFRHRLEEEPSRVRAMGGSISFFSVASRCSPCSWSGRLWAVSSPGRLGPSWLRSSS